jgi:plastocyanin
MLNSNKGISAVIVIFALAIVLIGGYFLFFNSENKNVSPGGDVTNKVPAPGFQDVDEMIIVEEGSNEKDDKISTLTVSYSDSGFEPKLLNIEIGEIVTWTNESSKGMWVGSDIHPTHEVYPEFDSIGISKSGESYSFSFNKAGKWKYHNHIHSSHTGTVIVQ